ncbi:MAG: MFS transporter [Candidatus Paceibacterota bacterium]
MSSAIEKIRYNRVLVALYISAFISALYFFSSAYINSTFLEELMTPQMVSLLFALGSIGNIIAYIFAPAMLRRVGNYALTLFVITLVFAIFVGLSVATTALIVSLLFIAYRILSPMLLFAFDIFLETVSEREDETGAIRGAFFTFINIATILAPVLAGIVLSRYGYSGLYLYSALHLIPLFLIIAFNFRKFKDPEYPSIKIPTLTRQFWNNLDLRLIYIISFILQFFYAWMIIYVPIYLHKHIGFSWDQIGLMLAIALVPFLLLELPLGRLADKKYGEKEMLIIGFIIMGVSTASLTFIDTASFLVWTSILFVTRIGASFVEIMTESYFFKHMKGSDADEISFFRINAPLAYLFGPIVGIIALSFVDYRFLFLILGVIVLSGIHYSIMITDTK